MADMNGMLDKAKEFAGEKAGEFLQGDRSELKEKITGMIQNVTPDSIDDKVPDVVDSAVDFIANAIGKKN
ncbi:MAG: hypothetical protein Q4E41_02410 [Bacteroidales bacterium]|nr:hypothetical protein [Muribaculaceae bacterium]MDO4970928.1 hypothetical protein [Bacteroidales bacterium]